MGKEYRNKKERVIMLASSALVLTALTVTGIYMQKEEIKSKDNGYYLDFTGLTETPNNKQNEIDLARRNKDEGERREKIVTDNDLDYMPIEVDSNKIEIGKKKTVESETTVPQKTVKTAAEKEMELSKIEEELPNPAAEIEEAPVISVAAPVEPAPDLPPQLDFHERDGLLRPISGAVLLPYSMDSSIYFTTLDQFKYNPALIIGAEEGDIVAVAADGIVTKIYDDPEIGHAVAVDIGNGYTLTYGQLQTVNFGVGDFVGCGQALGTIAAPSKYYTAEGANLFLCLTRDGEAIDPEELFRY